MRLRTSPCLLAALVAVGAVTAACSSGSETTTRTCTGTPANLVGTYSLRSYTLAGTTYTYPAATGQLRFHASTYGVDLTLPGPLAIPDSGTYTLTGSNCIAQSSVMGNPQFVGTYTFVNDTLSVTGTAAMMSVANIWVKQP